MKPDTPLPDPSQPFIVYHLTEKWDGGTLVSALKELVLSTSDKPISWGQVRKWVHQRHIEVNGNLCVDETRRVQAGDVLKLWHHSRPKPIQSKDVRLRYVDQHLCVVEKPPGITSVRHARESGLSAVRRQLQPTLDELVPQVLSNTEGPFQSSMLSGRFQPTAQPFPGNHKKFTRNLKGKKNKQNPQRPGEGRVWPVHRLDHHTSGLMLFARTREAEQKLVSLFRKHQVHREYVGVCHGKLKPQTIRSFLVRDRGDGLRGSLPKNPTAQQLQSAQEAITHVVGSKAIGQGRYSLFRCRLETGRTHQIRIHLSEIGHRLCGEQLYVFDANGNRLGDESGAPRQALHCDRLSLTHPITAEPLRFEMPWTRDLSSWIQSLAD